MPSTFLWVFKFDVKLGFGEHNFRNYHIHVTFQIFGSKHVIFFLAYLGVFWKFIIFFEKCKFSNLQQVGDLFFWSKSSFSAGGGGHKIWVLVGGFNFRLSNHNVPPGSSANLYARGPKGRVWWDGWDGWDGPEKCPLIFFIFSGYIGIVNIYVYMSYICTKCEENWSTLLISHPSHPSVNTRFQKDCLKVGILKVSKPFL